MSLVVVVVRATGGDGERLRSGVSKEGVRDKVELNVGGGR